MEGGRLGKTVGHAVRFQYNYEGSAMPEPGFGGVSKGKVTVKDHDIEIPVFGTTGATYTGDVRCGQRTSKGGISYWEMAEANFGGNVRGPWQYFAVAHDASQDPDNPDQTDDRFLFILSNIRMDTDCPRMPDFFTYHPDEGRGPEGCEFRRELREDGSGGFIEVVTEEPNEKCRVWNPGNPNDEANREFPEGCRFVQEGGNKVKSDECFVNRTLTAVWTGGNFGQVGGCDTGLNRCSVDHRYVVGGGGKK